MCVFFDSPKCKVWFPPKVLKYRPITHHWMCNWGVCLTRRKLFCKALLNAQKFCLNSNVEGTIIFIGHFQAKRINIWWKVLAVDLPLKDFSFVGVGICKKKIQIWKQDEMWCLDTKMEAGTLTVMVSENRCQHNIWGAWHPTFVVWNLRMLPHECGMLLERFGGGGA